MMNNTTQATTTTTATMYPNYQTRQRRPEPFCATRPPVHDRSSEKMSAVSNLARCFEISTLTATEVVHLKPVAFRSSPYFATAGVCSGDPDARVAIYAPGATVYLAPVELAMNDLSQEERTWLKREVFWSRTQEGQITRPYAIAKREGSIYHVEMTCPEALTDEAYAALVALDSRLHARAASVSPGKKVLVLPAHLVALAVVGVGTANDSPTAVHMWSLEWV